VSSLVEAGGALLLHDLVFVKFGTGGGEGGVARLGQAKEEEGDLL